MTFEIFDNQAKKAYYEPPDWLFLQTLAKQKTRATLRALSLAAELPLLQQNVIEPPQSLQIMKSLNQTEIYVRVVRNERWWRGIRFMQTALIQSEIMLIQS